jgi:hypothetical protein
VKWLGRHRISGRVFTFASEIPLLPLSFCLLGSTGKKKNHSLGFFPILSFSFKKKSRNKFKNRVLFSSSYKRVLLLIKDTFIGFPKAVTSLGSGDFQEVGRGKFG